METKSLNLNTYVMGLRLLYMFYSFNTGIALRRQNLSIATTKMISAKNKMILFTEEVICSGWDNFKSGCDYFFSGQGHFIVA